MNLGDKKPCIDWRSSQISPSPLSDLIHIPSCLHILLITDEKHNTPYEQQGGALRKHGWPPCYLGYESFFFQHSPTLIYDDHAILPRHCFIPIFSILALYLQYSKNLIVAVAGRFVTCLAWPCFAFDSSGILRLYLHSTISASAALLFDDCLTPARWELVLHLTLPDHPGTMSAFYNLVLSLAFLFDDVRLLR